MFNSKGLKALIEKAQLTQDTAAEAIGISSAALRSYLKDTQPHIDSLMKIADYFAVPLDFLMSRCSEEQAKAILDNYSEHFMELRRASYESYLKGRRKQLISCTTKQSAVEEPYPYNLAAAINGKPVDFVLSPENIKGLEWAISTLTEREQYVITSYYKEGKNFEDIGETYCVTRERIRQLLAKAVRKLSSPHRKNAVFEGWHSFEEIDRYADTVLKDREEKLKEAEKDLSEREKHLNEKENAVNELIDSLRIQGHIDATKAALAALSGNTVSPSLSRPIEEMDLSTRAYTCISRAGLKTIKDVIIKLETDVDGFKTIRNLGKKSYEEILYKLNEMFRTTIYTDRYL